MTRIPFPLGFKIVETSGTTNTGIAIDDRQVFASSSDRTAYDSNFFYEGLLSYTIGLPYHVSGVTSDAGFYYRNSANTWTGFNSDTIDDKHANGTMDSTSVAESDPTTGTNIVNHINYLYTLNSALSTGRTWKEPVLNVTTTIPGSPTAGDRYAINGVGTGDWTGHDGDIAIFTTIWTFEDPSVGWAVLNLTDGKIYSYVASTPYWIQTSSDLPILSGSVDGIVSHTWYTDLYDVVTNTSNYLNKSVFGYVVVENDGSPTTGSPVTATIQQDSFTINTVGGLTSTISGKIITIDGSGLGTPSNASFWTSKSESGLSNEVNIGALTTGLVKITVSGGIATPTTAIAGTDYQSPITVINGLNSPYPGTIIRLGGNLTENTSITLGSYNAVFVVNSTGIFSVGSLHTGGIVVTTTGGFTTETIGSSGGGYFAFSSTGVSFISSIALGGIKYSGDYSSGFTDRSLVDKAYVDNRVGGSDGYVQYNNTGILDGDSTFFFNNSSKILYVDYLTMQYSLTLGTSVIYTNTGNLTFYDTVIGTVTLSDLLNSGGVTPVDDILDWSTDKYIPYTSQTAGCFDNSSTNPIHTNRLNYDGNFYAHEIHGFASTTFGVFGFASSSGAGVSGASITGAGISGSSGSGYLGEFVHSVNTTRSNPYIYISKETTGTVDDTSNIIYINDNPATSGTISGSVLKVTVVSTVRIDMNPRVAATGESAYILDTHNALTTSNILSLRNQGVAKNYITSSGKNLYTAGTSSTFVITPGIIKDFYTDASTSGTGETDLYSYTVPANILATNGDKLLGYYIINSSANNSIEVYFATSSIGLLDIGTNTYKVNFEIIRVSSTVARCSVSMGNYQNVFYTELTSKDWTTTNILKVTGTALTGTVTARFGSIEYKPAAIN
jgi:hypothetical protein